MSELKFVLVIYDIADNKRRRRAAKVLESYGERVQESAFECELTEARLARLKSYLSKALKEDEDSVRIYQLNSYNIIMTFGVNIETSRETFGFV